MRTRRVISIALKSRLSLALGLVTALALVGPAASGAAPAPSVLTFKTVKVGAPGNPSVGIVPFTDAVYSSCAEVVPAEKQPPCQEVGGGRLPLRDRPARGHGRPVRRLPQHRRSRRPQQAQALQLHRERLSMAQVRPDRLLRRRCGRAALLGRLAGMGRQALRLRQLPALGPLRQLALQRPGALQAGRAAPAAFSYVTYRVRLSRQTETGMYDMHSAGDDPLAQDRLRHPQPERVDQGRLLRPQRRRQILLLAVPDQRRRLRRRRRRRAALRPR